MLLHTEKLGKRNLTIFINMINQCNANLTHQRGPCDNFNCESCLRKNLCYLLCDLSEDLQKELENLQNDIDK